MKTHTKIFIPTTMSLAKYLIVAKIFQTSLMMASKTSTWKKMLTFSLLDTGTSTSLMSHNIAKEFHLDIIIANYITLKAADGEELLVNAISTIW